MARPVAAISPWAKASAPGSSSSPRRRSAAPGPGSHQNRQRKGAGRLLLQGVEEAARAAGMPGLSAHVSLTARPLFEAMGFTALAERRVPLRGQVLTNFRMERPLQTPGQPS